MDPEGIKAIGAYLTFYAGLIGIAFAWEVVRTVLFGIVLLYVLKKHREWKGWKR